MERKDLVKGLETDLGVNQTTPLKPNYLSDKAHLIKQRNNCYEFYHLLRSHQISNNSI